MHADVAGDDVSQSSSLYDIPRTAFMQSGTDLHHESQLSDSSDNETEEQSSSHHSRPVSKSSHLEDIPEGIYSLVPNDMQNGISTSDNESNEFGNKTPTDYNNSVGLYENAQVSASGDMYDVPRSLRQSQGKRFTRL